MKSCIVIGNGASLKGFDFKTIDRNVYDTIGCTLAFRYWLKYNWFPDIYVNIDTVVCEKNNEVLEFVKMKKCKLHLLSKSILNVWNDYEPTKDIIFIEDMLQDIGSIFKYVKNWCSGSSAVLLALQIYNNVKMIGFDCDYVEYIPECIKLDDGTLQIKHTPTNNPNYFMDDYQRAGDIYNVPNGKRVHLQSWKELSYIIDFINKMYPENERQLVNYNDKTSVSEYIKTYSLEDQRYASQNLFEKKTKKNSIAFIVPCTSNKRNWQDFSDTYLCNILLPSIVKLSNDYNVKVYIGIDDDDKLFGRVENRPDKYGDIYLQWLKFSDCKGNPCKIWTECSKRAVDDGYEYFQVCGDDIQFDNRNEWLSKFIKAVKKNNNIGYSAGWSNNDSIPTQFLFHKRHLEIFGWIFPPQIHNWFCDDFIHGLYGKKYGNWFKEYKHLNVGGEPRYTPNDDRRVCKMLINRHKKTLNGFLKQLNK